MRLTHGMDRSIEFGASKIEEFVELSEPRRQVLGLPDQYRPYGAGVRHVTTNFCGGEADAAELGFKVGIVARTRHFALREVLPRRARGFRASVSQRSRLAQGP